jgi:hypothetical protein
MAVHVTPSHRRFTVESEPFDATSNWRPDPSWLFRDAAGHEHRWWTNGAPATAYSPEHTYEVPTIRRVIDEQWIDEDGSEREASHLECLECGEHVEPGHMSDTYRQFIPGIRRFYIDGEPATEEEMRAALKAEGYDL